MTMTLEQVRDWHLARDREQRIVGFDLGAINHKGMADAIDANLTEIRAVIAELRVYDTPATNTAADKLTRALGNAQLVDVEKSFAGFRIVENADVPDGEVWVYDKSKLVGRITAALQEKGNG